MTIYTRTGDQGDTSLFGGGRVAKNDARVRAYGDVDELNAALGVVTAAAPTEFEAELLAGVQRHLFAIGSLLAAPHPGKVIAALEKAALTTEDVEFLEQAIDRIDGELPELRSFIVPGGCNKAALFHWARVVCRRAERSVVELGANAELPPAIVAYLNRLSDLLFVLARLANQRADVPDQVW